MAKKQTTPIESYTLKNGQKLYRFKIYVGVDPLTGKEMRTTRSGFKTKKEAEIALARIKVEIDKGAFRKARAETYNDMYDLWVKHYENTVEESTFVKTVRIFKNHILPALGIYKIDKINVDICQKCVDAWGKKLVNFRMVKAYAAKVLDFSIKRGYIQNNPFKLIDMPNGRKKLKADEEEHENFYNKDQLIKLLKCMEHEQNYKAFAFFQLLSYSGMRKGEAFALTWKDVNFKTNEIRINKAISAGKNNRLYLKDTKTGDSRVVKMDAHSMGILFEWKKLQKKEYFSVGINTTQQKQLVFSNETNDFLRPTKSKKWLDHVLNKYKLPKITTHGFRHTHCSLLLEAGVSIKEVQDRLGHSDIQTTMNIYAHVSKQAKEEAINKFDSFMSM